MAVPRTAIFGAGCFWGVEAVFRGREGILDTEVGYCGGEMENPSYEDVCSGRTGHVEVVRLRYDPERISYLELLDLFWDCHDPTSMDRQGPDQGTQYRSVIFWLAEDQHREAELSKGEREASGKYDSPIVTRIEAAGTFWPAEERHQHYVEKHSSGACGLHHAD